MGINITDGKVTISATYGATVNRGDFNSEKLSQGIVVEYAVDGADSSAAVAQAESLYEGLEVAVKTAVIKGLGLDADFDDKGVLQAKFAATPAPAAAPFKAPAEAPFGGGGDSYKPKADLAGNPRFTADLDGRGVATWIDLRPTKASGAFSANAADFRDAANSKHQVWLKDKQGNVKAQVAEALTAAGVAV